MYLEKRRFVTAAEKVDFVSPWTLEEWLCRSDVVPNRELLMVRANMEAGHSHPFHTHPTREEIIYVLSGRAEQWIGREHRILGPGEMVLIPKARCTAPTTLSASASCSWRFYLPRMPPNRGLLMSQTR